MNLNNQSKLENSGALQFYILEYNIVTSSENKEALCENRAISTWVSKETCVYFGLHCYTQRLP